MAEDLMRYDLMAQDALRGVVKAALKRAARTGLPGDHHFFIAFDTKHPGVKISERLRKKYPEDMTIVLQHQFWSLEVYDDRFEVDLSFDNIPERLSIPLTAIKGFFDPSVQFGLQFEVIKANQNAENHDQGAVPEGSVSPIGLLPASGQGAQGRRNDDSEATATAGSSAQSRKGRGKGETASGQDPATHSDSDKAPGDGPEANVVKLDMFRKK
ncbi:SspB family protein [Rhodoligotrophos ferricapiens]|uniref:SspB family protein n=1 Tax=Rhodoligotrophos ferricapiens TaxID=3069264 RepID=UPI00315CBCD9